MAITAANGAAIPNVGPVLSNAQAADAATAIAAVQLADVWRYGVKIADTPTIRVDSQLNHAAGYANLQVQTNGANSKTVAAVLVQDSVGNATGPRADAQRLNAIRMIRGALQNSLGNRLIITLTGTPG